MSTASETARPTRALAEFIAKASYEDLPTGIAESAKLYILDSIGSQIAGATLGCAQVPLGLLSELGGVPESTILTTGQKTNSLFACYVNAALGNALDIDDTYLASGHPGATVVPAALAVGEKLGSSGRELINAVVLGYEVSLRICDAIRPSQERERITPSMATWQIFGAMTAAAKLLNLDATRIAAAFGFAGASAPVPFKLKQGQIAKDRPMTEIKNNFGWATMGGVLAAYLAARGLQGNQTLFDGPDNFALMIGSDRCDHSRFTSGLGTEFLMPITGFKRYQCCRRLHTMLDALHEMIDANRIDPRQVAGIRVDTITNLHDNYNIRQPVHETDAHFSIPPLVALTLAGYPMSRGIAMERLNDQLIQDLMDRVEIRIGAEEERIFQETRQVPATVTITLQDGTVLKCARRSAVGNPDNPMTPEQIKAKFLDLTTPVIGEPRSKRILGAVERLDTLSHVADVAAV